MCISASILLLSSCFLRRSQSSYQPTDLRAITALDLSEDKSVLSSHNDELMVSIFFGSEIEGKWYFNGYRLSTVILDSVSRSFAPPNVDLSSEEECSTCVVWICLTEIDEDGSEDKTHAALLQLIGANGYAALDSKAEVDAVIKDNDFLGLVKISYNDKNLKKKYIISGQDLLDKYVYEIIIGTSEPVEQIY